MNSKFQQLKVQYYFMYQGLFQSSHTSREALILSCVCVHCIKRACLPCALAPFKMDGNCEEMFEKWSYCKIQFQDYHQEQQLSKKSSHHQNLEQPQKFSLPILLKKSNSLICKVVARPSMYVFNRDVPFFCKKKSKSFFFLFHIIFLFLSCI